MGFGFLINFHKESYDLKSHRQLGILPHFSCQKNKQKKPSTKVENVSGEQVHFAMWLKCFPSQNIIQEISERIAQNVMFDPLIEKAISISSVVASPGQTRVVMAPQKIAGDVDIV